MCFTCRRTNLQVGQPEKCAPCLLEHTGWCRGQQLFSRDLGQKASSEGPSQMCTEAASEGQNWPVHQVPPQWNASKLLEVGPAEKGLPTFLLYKDEDLVAFSQSYQRNLECFWSWEHHRIRTEYQVDSVTTGTFCSLLWADEKYSQSLPGTPTQDHIPYFQ